MYLLESYPFWLLSATVLAGLLYPVWRISQSGRRVLRNSILSASKSSVPIQRKAIAGRHSRSHECPGPHDHHVKKGTNQTNV